MKISIFAVITLIIFAASLTVGQSKQGNIPKKTNMEKIKEKDSAKSEAEQMETLYALGMPGEFHKSLESLVGEWNVVMNIYPAPDAKPITSSGMISNKKWILGNRQIQEEIIAGEIGGMEHRKLTILGYNNVNGRYEFTTFDNLDTQAMSYHGTADASGKVITLTASYTQAAFGGLVTGDGVGRADGPKAEPKKAIVGVAYTIRDVLTIESNNRHKLQMYFTPATGKEMLTAEYIYTRK